MSIGLSFLTRGGTRTSSFRAFIVTACFALATSMMFGASADARIGGGGSFGSRGSRTYSMPSATPTAPRISPFQRSATPNGGFSQPSSPSPGFANGARGGFFGGGFGRGLLGGFIGAGLFGMLFGNGFAGGLGGGMSLIGLILQLGLLFVAFKLFMGWMASRRQPGLQNGGSMFGGAPSNGSGFGQGGGGFAGGAPATRPISIGPDDYSAFERRLAESQAAYSNGDLATLNRIATPEMAQNFAQELAENDRHGVVNKISDVNLLQGDLSEAWRENGTDYATVAMRFSLVDATVDRTSGRVVSGDDRTPQQVTEVWTFRRPAGAAPQAWTLSGIQQS